MIEQLPATPGVVALRATGRLDERDINEAIALIEDALASQERIAILMEIDIAGMSPGAITRDISYGIGKLRELHRFPRVAVVTAQDWIRRIAQVQHRLLPQIELQVFAPADRDAAMEWISQPLPELKTEEQEPAEPAVREIETDQPNLIAFEIDGRIRGSDMRLLIPMFDAAMTAHPKLRVLVRILNFNGISLDALRAEGLVAMKMKGLRQVERYAVVGGPDWLKSATERIGPWAPIKTRHFPAAGEAEAWAWLQADSPAADPPNPAPG
jgi:hypothetical protein